MTSKPTPATSLTVSPLASSTSWPTSPMMSPSGSPSFSSTRTSRVPPAGMTASSRIAVGGRFSVGAPTSMRIWATSVSSPSVAPYVNTYVPAASGSKNSSPSGVSDTSSESIVRSAGRTSVGCWATNRGSSSGSVSLARTASRIGLPTTVTPASLRASGSLLASARRTLTITVPSSVAPKSSLAVYVSSMRSAVVFGSGVNTTWPEASGTIRPAVLTGSSSAIESRTSASPSGSVSLARTSNVVARPRRVDAMSLCASGGRLALPSDARTSTVTLAEALASRPSVIV